MSSPQAIVDLFSSLSASPSGFALTDGGILAQLVSKLFSSQKGITALVAGAQAGFPLQATWNEVNTATGTGTDSVVLPLALPGNFIFVNNTSGQTIGVWGVAQNPSNGNAGDTIAAANSDAQQPTATGVTQVDTLASLYVCTTLGQWKKCDLV